MLSDLTKLKRFTDNQIKQNIDRSKEIIKESLPMADKLEPEYKCKLIMRITEMIMEAEEQMNNRLVKSLGKKEDE